MVRHGSCRRRQLGVAWFGIQVVRSLGPLCKDALSYFAAVSLLGAGVFLRETRTLPDSWPHTHRRRQDRKTQKPFRVEYEVHNGQFTK